MAAVAMTLSSLIKILAIYAIFALITYGFIQRERQDVGAAGQGARAKSMFWALIWPIYWLAVVGPKTSLNHAAKFLLPGGLDSVQVLVHGHFLAGLPVHIDFGHNRPVWPCQPLYLRLLWLFCRPYTLEARKGRPTRAGMR